MFDLVSTNILADRLAKLENAGIISRARDAENQTKYIYSLTEKGRELLPLLLEMTVWSAKYDPPPGAPDNIISGAPAQLLSRWANDREALIAEIVANLS